MTVRLQRAALLTLFPLLIAAPVAGQLQVVGYGAAEWDVEKTSVYVLGGALQSTRLGWSPAFNVVGYLVDLPTDVQIKAINPSLGLQYRMPASAVQVRAGYAFVDDGLDTVGDVFAGPSFGGSESGVTTAAQYNYWGTGVTSLEAIANMNWADSYLWARGRASRRVLTLGDGNSGLGLGAELVLQGNDDYRATQFGGLVELGMPAVKLIGGVGYKLQDTYDDALYFRLEAVILR